MTAIPGLIAALLFYRAKLVKASIIGGIALAFFVCGLLAPSLLRPIERFWIKLGETIGKLMTPVVLGLAYFLVVTPLGYLVRFLGKDLLELKIDKDKPSYWHPAEKDGPSSRPYLPY